MTALFQCIVNTINKTERARESKRVEALLPTLIGFYQTHEEVTKTNEVSR